MEIGLYEQIINKLFEVKLEQLDSDIYYVGKKKIDASNVAKYLSRYLYGLFDHVFSQLSQDEETAEKAINLANNIIKSLARDFYLDDNDLISAKSEILTAVIDKTKCEFPDIAERLKEITPLTPRFVFRRDSLLTHAHRSVQHLRQVPFAQQPFTRHLILIAAA